jgi:hypothetical protein
MTLEELRQKLAVEKLIETGIGLVSPKTYRDICESFAPEQRISCDKGPPMIPQEIHVAGIRLLQNPLIPDGEIYPFEKWELRPKTPTKLPL